MEKYSEASQVLWLLVLTSKFFLQEEPECITYSPRSQEDVGGLMEKALEVKPMGWNSRYYLICMI